MKDIIIITLALFIYTYLAINLYEKIKQYRRQKRFEKQAEKITEVLDKVNEMIFEGHRIFVKENFQPGSAQIEDEYIGEYEERDFKHMSKKQLKACLKTFEKYEDFEMCEIIQKELKKRNQ